MATSLMGGWPESKDNLSYSPIENASIGNMISRLINGTQNILISRFLSSNHHSSFTGKLMSPPTPIGDRGQHLHLSLAAGQVSLVTRDAVVYSHWTTLLVLGDMGHFSGF